jgi:hypothetical protein
VPYEQQSIMVNRNQVGRGIKLKGVVIEIGDKSA